MLPHGLLKLFAVIGAALSVAVPGAAQRVAGPVSPLIVSRIDLSRTVSLRGNVHPLAVPSNDQGEAAPDLPMLRMMLVLTRGAEQEKKLQQTLRDQQDPRSSEFHQWLTPDTFGVRFGAADSDLAAISGWLASSGFTSIQLNRGRTAIEFSGSVRCVERAFHTPIHRYLVDGEMHTANSADPQIPAALAPVVAGVVTLHNFPRHRHSRLAGEFTRDPKSGVVSRIADSQARHEVSQRSATGNAANPSFTIADDLATYYAVGPADFATIYNLNPLLTATTPIDGSGQTIAIAGETDIQTVDFVNFRQMFGLPLGVTSGPTGTQYLKIIHNGVAPGITSKGEELEANVDTQWSSAVAPGATIDLVVSSSTETTPGIDLSAEYIVDNNLAPVMSTSYGECELSLGAAGNAFYNSLYEQASAQGITVFTSSGDTGSDSCEGNTTTPAGLSVSGLTSTPYNVSVGGTDFNMPGNAAKYWSATNSNTAGSSAISYIPELAWNVTCGNPLWGSTPAFSGESPEQVCNDVSATDDINLVNVEATGGGRSSCIQSNGTAASCSAGYAKPSWQSGPGVPADGVRDVPDVSLFASAGVVGDYPYPSIFKSFYIVCQQDLLFPPGPCGLTGQYPQFSGVGGTSVSSPAFAAVLALVNQKTGSRQGNANYVFYKLAAQQDAASCDSAKGSGSSCVFNDVTTGNNAIPCRTGARDCKTTHAGDFYGVIEDYPTTPGYDLATGLGSVNIANLVNGWSSVKFASTSTALTVNPSTAVHGSPVSVSATVTAADGTPTGSVSINGTAVNGSVGEGELSQGVVTENLRTLPGGTYGVVAHYAGDGTYEASDSAPAMVTVTPEPSAGDIVTKSYDPFTGLVNSVTSAPYGTLFIVRADVSGASGFGTPTGTVALTDQGKPLGIGTYALNQEGSAEDLTTGLLAGQHALQFKYSGDASFKPETVSQSLTVTPMAMECGYIVPNTNVIEPGWGVNIYVSTDAAPTSAGQDGQYPNGPTVAPGGTVSFFAGSTLLGGPIAVMGTPGAFPTQVGGIITLQIPSANAEYFIPASALASQPASVTAVYSGDANHTGCTFPPVSLSYQPRGILPSTTFAFNTTGVIQGPQVAFFVSVEPITPPPVYEPPYPAPTGSVQMLVDSVATGTSVPLIAVQGASEASANVLLSTASLPNGSHFISFSYAGDANYSIRQCCVRGIGQRSGLQPNAGWQQSVCSERRYDLCVAAFRRRFRWLQRSGDLQLFGAAW